MQYSIVNLSEVKKNSDFRIDAEYWKPEYYNLDKKLRSNSYRIVGDCFDVTKLAGYEYTEYFTHKNTTTNNFYKVLTSKNIQSENLALDNYLKIDKKIADDFLQRSKLNKNDIVFSYTGEYRRSLVLQEDNFQLGPNICLMRNKSERITPNYLSIFLNSNIGQSILNREKTFSAQPTISMERIRSIPIPILSQPFQQSIASLVNTSYTLRQSADTLYKEAEEILLEELGLKNYQPQNKKCFVKMLSDTQEAGRIDAEYFQPKYEDVIDKIKKYKNGFLFFEDKDINDKNFNPKKDIEYKYIELANISGNSSIDGVENIIGCDLPTRARRIVKADDLIVSSIEGSLNSIALISKKLDGALCSTGFFVVNSNKINSEALLVFLKSNLGQMQLKRGCKGTILTAISKDELKNLIVPLLPQSIQSQISAKIQQSFESREKSKQLLEVAKRAVEIAIEENEEAGLKYIEENK